MYDFHFGTKAEIENDPKKYLLTIKRMLPRWCNSIPDSEYLAIYDVVSGQKLSKSPVFVETGSGASTIVLCYLALLNDGELYTWDINGSKLFYLRSVLNDTLMRHFSDKNLSNHWKYTAFDSNSEFAGISILKELGKKISACFLDSEHTLNVLMKELKAVCELLETPSIVAIDDGNYFYKAINVAYINMLRKKHGLTPIKDLPENIGGKFWEEVYNYLKGRFKKVEFIQDSYKESYKADLFWAYFQNEKEITRGLEMERVEGLDHRFDAWRIEK